MAETASQAEAPLQLVGKLDGKIEKGKAVVSYKLDPTAPTDEGDFEYVAVARVPSRGLSRQSERPLEVHIDRDVTKVELYLLERKGEAVDEVDYEITFPDGEKRTGTTDGGGFVHEEKQGKVEKATVKFTPPGAHDPVSREVWLDPGDPQTDEGVKRRLQNLGYDVSKLADAVRQFEVDHGLPPDGEIDEEFRSELVASHDKGGILRPTKDATENKPDSGRGKDVATPDLPEHPPVAAEKVTPPLEARSDLEPRPA
jgi:hypothetical protein